VSIEKLLILGGLAMLLIGPERLPGYAARLGQIVRTGRRMLDDAKVRVQDELGEDFDADEWRKLDPRQYDPRRIIRDALLEPPEVTRDDDVVDDEPVLEPEPEVVLRSPKEPAVFDSEAT
jgi:sec-independent protein translocase protein TatB